MNEKWLKQYKENYEGKSAEAKEVAEFIKENYKGNSYIPWATMERLTYMQDPNAKFEKIRNDKGGLVHTDSFVNENLVENKDGIVSKTSAAVVSHFVKVSLVFLGKEFIEEFPIQEQDYSPAKIYNQNLVNKALQRALAKVASRATGIGLRIYENKDLQFDTPEEDKKPEIKKTTKTTKTTKPTESNVTTSSVINNNNGIVVTENNTTEQVPSQATYTEEDLKQDTPVQEVVTQDTKIEENAPKSYDKSVLELCSLIRNTDKEKMTKILQNLNVPILKQHGFTLNLEDSDDVLCEKISHFTNVVVFTKAITNMIG